MPVLETSDFGPIEYTETEVFSFPLGLPGFPGRTRFLLVERPGWRPFVFLQSGDDPALRFIAIPVDLIDSAYHLALGTEELELLQSEDPASGLMVLALVTFQDHEPPSVNLLAPIVLNPAKRRGLQAVQDDSAYSHRHPLRHPPSPEEPSCS